MKKKEKKQKKFNASLIFLGAVISTYFLIAFFNAEFVLQSAQNTLKMFMRILPILIFVFFINVLINIYAKPEIIQKYLGEKSGIKSWLYTILAGILVSGPPYILFPLLGDLQKRGMKNSLIAVLLYNRNVKIPFIPVMIYYFGLKFTIIASIYLIVFSVFNGLIVGKLTEV